MKITKLTGLLLCAGMLGSAAHAQELTGTLKKIKESGSITIGARDYSVPFSYLDDKQSYQGYTIDLCMKVVASLKKQLGMDTLTVKFNPVTSATRIPLMTNGTIDLECGNTTNNLERQKLVAYAPTMFVTSNRLISKKSSNINSLADMKGKSIISTSGTSNLKQVVILNNEQNLGLNILTVQDTAEAFLMVETGRATAFAMDDIILASMAASSKTPTDFSITKEALSVEPYGIMMRREDPDFKKAVDNAVIATFKSGDIHRIYKKWFESPIPPKGVNLNWPMSASLKAVIANPTDSGDPAAYAVVPPQQKAAAQAKKK